MLGGGGDGILTRGVDGVFLSRGGGDGFFGSNLRVNGIRLCKLCFRVRRRFPKKVGFFLYVFIHASYILSRNECGIHSVAENIHAYSEGRLRSPEEYEKNNWLIIIT